MAIIYETQKDFEREKLKDQSKDMYLKSANQGGTGLAAYVLGTIASSFDRNSEKTGILSFVGFGLAVFGVVKVVQSLFTGHKAHSLHLEKERMGPQTVIFPPDVQSGVENGGKECCGKSKFSNVKPTSFREQVEKHLSTLGRE